MKKSIVALLLFVALGCKRNDGPADPLDHVFGKYAVEYYIVDGDTAFSKSGIDKYGISDFHYDISRKGSDSVIVMQRYKPDGSDNYCGWGTLARVSEVDGVFELDNQDKTLLYESAIEGKVFRERTQGMNIDSLFARLKFDSLRSPYVPPMREIIVQARK